MLPADNTSAKGLIRIVSALALAILSAALILTPAPAEKLFLEWFLFFSLLLLFIALGPVNSWILALPLPYKMFLAVLLFFAGTSQLAQRPELTFPFVPWTMYDTLETSPEAEVYVYLGVQKSGSYVLLNPGHVFPSLAQSRLMTGLQTLASSTRKKDLIALRSALLALGQEYNRQKPVSPIDIIVVIRGHINIKTLVSPKIQRKIIFTVDLKKAVP